jgi:hypothetical protein
VSLLQIYIKITSISYARRLHDIKKLSKNNKVIYFEGSLAKVSTSDIDENLGFIGIGGINKHIYLIKIQSC